MKTHHGILGALPGTWLTKLQSQHGTPKHPAPGVPGLTPSPAGSSGSEAGGTPPAKRQKVINHRQDPGLKLQFGKAGVKTINDLLKQGAGKDIVKPTFGALEACLTWLLKGYCFSDCPRKDCHKHAGPVAVAATNKLLDDCNVPN